MATNKNQHFVPRCYLKAFTQNGENLAINLLNLDRQRVIPAAPVKNQCSRDYFYGQDPLLEAAIQGIEGGYAATSARIHAPNYQLTDIDRSMLRMFMQFQHMRTEAASRRYVEMQADMTDAIGTSDLKPSIKEAVQLSMHAFSEEMHVLEDLKVCLVRNRTSHPFITSDDPVAIANRWYKEDRRVHHKSPGLLSCGTSIFLPLSPRVMCIAYDGDVYSIPHQNGWTEVKRKQDVDAFNEFQLLNASANVYFRDWGDSDWVLSSFRSVQDRRLACRHRLTYAVLDDEVGAHKRYRVVESKDAESHQEALIHTQTLSPTPSKWPTQLQWRAKGSVFTNGTGTGYIRAAEAQFRSTEGYRRESTGH